jgi:DNA-binding LytR/AlgR family response regulator
MSRVRVLIVEDEAPQRAALLALFAELWPEADVVAACADGLEALEAFERERPEVVLLDIRMPGLSGLEVARSIGGRAHVVFVTAYEEHALRAFDAGAIDYLLKPIRRERLIDTITRLRHRLHSEGEVSRAGVADPVALLDRLRDQLALGPRREALKWITASVGDTVKLFPIDEVLAFQAQDKYTRVVTAGDEALIRKSLKDLVALLDPDVFWQVHRSVIVRAAAIDRVQKDELGKLWLTLKAGGERLPVSTAFQGRFRGM